MTENVTRFPDDPYQVLVVHVVAQSFRDITVKVNRKDGQRERERKLEAAKDGMDFILHRLWEEGNIYGEALREYGITQCTIEQAFHGAMVVRGKQGGRNDLN